MTKQVTIDQFLTDAEIAQATRLYRTAKSGTYNRLLTEQIIQPNIERINTALGQENDVRYLAYAVEFVISKAVGA